MSDKYRSHHQRSSSDLHRGDRSPPYVRSKDSDQRNGRERSRSPRRRKVVDDFYYASKEYKDRHGSRERRKHKITDIDSERTKDKNKEPKQKKRALRNESVDSTRQSCSESPEHERGRHPRRSPSPSSSGSRSSSRHSLKRHRHRRHRSQSADEHDHKSKHSSSSRHKDKHRSPRKKRKNEYDKDERRSVLTGKKIKLKVHKDAADHERDANRESLLQFLNSAYD